MSNKEIGGYIELDRYSLPMLHADGIKLNCGRNALAYLLEAKKIQKIAMPTMMCDSCTPVLKRYNVQVRYYAISTSFHPVEMTLEPNEYLYLVNYYGQLSNEYISELKRKYQNIIVDNAQAYFQSPVKGVDTLYTCRKFFGVSDGAILYTDKTLGREYPQDTSYKNMDFLLGRFERTASEFYARYAENNKRFENEPIQQMSKLTENLLHGIDYTQVSKIRTQNFETLHRALATKNKLELKVPTGAFMYPLLLENGAEVRKKLLESKIYIPTLWPNVLADAPAGSCEYNMAENILPLPVDQRYSQMDIKCIIDTINGLLA